MDGLSQQVQQLDKRYKGLRTDSSVVIRDTSSHGKALHILSYVCQVTVIFTVVVVCLVNLSLGEEKSSLWSSLLSLALGCMLPNPKIRRDNVKQQQFLPSPAFQLESPLLSRQHHDPIHDSLAEDGGTNGGTLGMRAIGDDVQ